MSDTRAVDLREAYSAVRSLTEALADPLTPEDQTVQSMPDVSPTKWHRAHTSWFFEEFVLGPHLADYAPFEPAYRYLFNSYYEAVGPRHPRPERGHLSRPTVEEIATYRRYVDVAMTDFLDEPTGPAIAPLVELGLHHEQQHQELLLMDIKHVLGHNPLRPLYFPEPAPASTAGSPVQWLAYSGGIAEIGFPHREGFAFDNESPRHQTVLNPYALASRTVTCGEWLAFIHDGGYRRPELWLSDGWAAVQQHGWEAPMYWRQRGDGSWRAYTLGGERDIDVNEPVCHISYYEADAFARWVGARLPSEQEWEHAVSLAAGDPGATLESRFDMSSLHPRSAPGGRMNGEALIESVGEVWEWTMSPYGPYPGYQPPAGALGEYNGKFMSNQYVLRGGSCATPPEHTRVTYRNFFPPEARWPFTGVRLARES